MEGEWKQKYDEVLKEMNVEKWIWHHNVCDWTSRFFRLKRFVSNCSWGWTGHQVYNIDEELEVRKGKK